MKHFLGILLSLGLMTGVSWAENADSHDDMDGQPGSNLQEFLSGSALTTPISVAVIINEKNPLTNLNLQQLELIFSGDAANWRAVTWMPVRKEDEAILNSSVRIYLPVNDAIAMNVFQHMGMEGRAFSRNAVLLKDPLKILAIVSKKPNAVAIMTWPFDRVEGVNVLAVNGQGPNVQSYPIYVDPTELLEQAFEAEAQEALKASLVSVSEAQSNAPAFYWQQPEAEPLRELEPYVDTAEEDQVEDSKGDLLSEAIQLLDAGKVHHAKIILRQLIAENPGDKNIQLILDDVNRLIDIKMGKGRAPAPSPVDDHTQPPLAVDPINTKTGHQGSLRRFPASHINRTAIEKPPLPAPYATEPVPVAPPPLVISSSPPPASAAKTAHDGSLPPIPALP